MFTKHPFFLWIFILLLAAFFALCAGHIWYTPWKVVTSIFSPELTLIKVWRLPRVITAAIIGALLGISGTVFQGLFRNPLAEPWLIGSSGGAAIGASLALLLSWSLPVEFILPFFSFIGAIGAALLVLSMARVAGSIDSATLLLAGIAVSAILTSIRSFLMLSLSNENISLQVVMSWMMGGVQAPTKAQGMLILITLSFIVFFIALKNARSLDLLGLGENMAKSYGLHTARASIFLLLIGSAAAALAVSSGGLVAFVGLAAPHIGRFFIGGRHKALLILSALIGAVIVVIADAFSRSLLPPGEIPLGLITAIIGGPFFLFLLVKKARRVWT